MKERQIKIITYILGQCEYSANTEIFSMILLNHILVILFLLDSYIPNMCMIIFVCILSNEIFLLNYVYIYGCQCSTRILHFLGFECLVEIGMRQSSLNRHLKCMYCIHTSRRVTKYTYYVHYIAT